MFSLQTMLLKKKNEKRNYRMRENACQKKSCKRPASIIHKEFLQYNNKKTNNLPLIGT